MSENPPVTWTIAVRNAMPYLPQTLESIAKQTYKNQKIIAWEDGSTDGTLAALREWIPSRIPGIVIDNMPLSLGLGRTEQIKMADTELIAVIDGDDIALPHRLERQVPYMCEHPEVAALGSIVQTIDEKNQPIDIWRYPTQDAEVRWLMRWQVRVLHPAMLLRKSALLNAGSYPDFKYEDSVLFVRMANMSGEIHNHPEVLTHYRRSSTSVTGRLNDPESWMPVNRSVAQYCAPTMFPGISDPKRALDLWEVTHPVNIHRKDFRVEPHHLRDLRKTAILMARQVGKPDDYFFSTDSFTEQAYCLRRRLLERFGLGPLLRLRERRAARRTEAGSNAK